MTGRNVSKINQVLQEWPKNTVVTQPWFTLLGVSSKLANWHVGSGWLQRFGTGAYTRPGDQVEWHGGVYALQTQLDKTVHVGGQTALELLGFSHFIPIGQQRKVLLVSDLQERLPTWFRNHQWNVDIEHRCLSLFEHVPEKSVTELDCGGFKIIMSGRERYDGADATCPKQQRSGTGIPADGRVYHRKTFNGTGTSGELPVNKS